MATSSNYLYWLIVGCEAAFWLVLVLALAARYFLRHEPLSRFLLLSLPAVDLLLLTFTTIDLRGGTTATFAHGLATAYVGFTVAFGGLAVRWADVRFAHRFAGGLPPVRRPTRGWQALRTELQLWLRSIVAWIITLALLSALIAFVGHEERTRELEQWFRIAFGSVFVWFVLGPVWNVLFMSRKGPTTIRPAKADEIDALIELAATTFHETYSGTDAVGEITDYVATHFTPRAFADILADSSMTLLVAESGKRLVGYLQLKVSAPPPCVSGPVPIELSRLYLRRDTIGTGLGADLMRATFAEARRRGRETLWLVVYSGNDKARDFYRRFGLVDVGLKDFKFGSKTYADPVMAAPVRAD
ncbi:MAG: GNAT family N-acetyltransferase [Pseudomonadota bacterium]